MITLKDLRLTEDGDLFISDQGDIVITDSVIQAIKIRLKWFLHEWKFNQKFGVPYYEDILIKNANKLHIEQIIRDQIMGVEKVQDVTDIEVLVNNSTRRLNLRFAVRVDDQLLREEMKFDV